MRLLEPTASATKPRTVARKCRGKLPIDDDAVYRGKPMVIHNIWRRSQ